MGPTNITRLNVPVKKEGRLGKGNEKGMWLYCYKDTGIDGGTGFNTIYLKLLV